MSPEEFHELRALAQRDAWERVHVDAQCTGKFRHTSKSEAERAIRKRGIHTYHCTYCHAWHVGGTNQVARLARISERERYAKES